jgi:hypothetical protein
MGYFEHIHMVKFQILGRQASGWCNFDNTSNPDFNGPPAPEEVHAARKRG